MIELADGYDEIYIDSAIFPNMWSDLRALITNGKKVFYFTRPWLWREARKRFANELRRMNNDNVKSDFGDAYLLYKIFQLSKIEWKNHKVFRPVTVLMLS